MTLPGSTSLQVGQPRYFGFPAVLLANLFAVAVGGVGLLPLAVLPLAFTLNLPPLLFAVLAFFDLVTVLAVMLMLFPVMLANPFVILLLRLSRQRPPDPGEFVCQVMITPRLQRGLRAVLEDAEDVGYLRVGPDELVFTGDHVQLALPRARIAAVRDTNAGWRGLWLCGRRISVVTGAFPGYTALEFLERQSWHVLGAQLVSRKLLAVLLARLP